MPFFERPARSILHPTDFSPTSQQAFAHALAIALANKASLRILHVIRDKEEVVPWDQYPAVRETLEQWGKLPEGSARSAVMEQLGIKVSKMYGVNKNVADMIAEITQDSDIDLLVMATNENRENPFWSSGSTSLKASRKTELPTLFVPEGVRGSVDMTTGETDVKQVLIAVDHTPDPQSAIERIAWSMDKFGGQESKITMLYVGDEEEFPQVDPPQEGKFEWNRLARKGNAAGEIVAAANELDADLIVMVTEGAKGFWNTLAGSTTRQVLRNAPCLLFTIPEGKFN